MGCSGVRIGDGAIISARSVVTADSPPYAIVGGNLGRVVRERLDSASVQRLLEIAWWDRPAEWIGRHLDLIRGGDVDALYAAARLEPAHGRCWAGLGQQQTCFRRPDRGGTCRRRQSAARTGH